MTAEREQACDGKVRHQTRQAAHAAVQALTGKGKDRMSAYRCPWCDTWHVGHRPNPRRGRR